MIGSIIARYNLSKQINTQQVASYISHIKNQTSNPDIPPQTGYAGHPLMKELFAAYEMEKRASKCFDFDDLLVETVRLFKKQPAFKAQFHERIRHVLVDEYQDTNIVQHELLQCMAKQDKKVCVDSICVVGDEDQSIYSWRGATVANIINFKKDFAPTKVVKLEQNYRSVQTILDVANHIIQNNHHRTPKTLWSKRVGDQRIVQLRCLSDYQEGESIATFLKETSRHQKLSDVAILYRTHFQSRTLEETLIRHSIPYTVIGGVQFYERKEIKDLLAYIRLMVNPFDRTSFFRIINCPNRSLGEKFEEIFSERWQQEPFLTFSDVGKKMIDEALVTGAKKTSLISFIQLFDNRTSNDAPLNALEHIIKSTSYFEYLKKAYAQDEAQERIENIKELLRAVAHLQAEQSTTSALFLEEVSLMQEHRQNKKNSTDPVLLMTLHAAKGLEFKTVIVTGLEEGLLPSSRSVTDSDALEEERRLFYVGITRAQERLLLTYSRYRYTYGKMSDQISSRFLDEVPKELAPLQDISHSQPAQVAQFFSQWLSPEKSQKATAVLTFGAKKDPAKKIVHKRSENTEFQKNCAWKKNQLVQHATFGVGVVKKVEQRNSGDFSLEVTFKQGTKKIAHTFLKPLS
jgi:DNA helicase-2/ATP-dependent DNA helicase PcrA